MCIRLANPVPHRVEALPQGSLQLRIIDMTCQLLDTQLIDLLQLIKPIRLVADGVYQFLRTQSRSEAWLSNWLSACNIASTSFCNFPSYSMLSLHR